MTWQQTLETKTALEQELKRISMIYQSSAKIEYARFLGMSDESLFHLTYEEWEKLNKLVYEFRNRAITAWSELPTHYKINFVTNGEIWDKYAKDNPEQVTAIKNSIKF